MNLPQEFVDKMKSLLGRDSDDFFASLDKPSQKGITINTNRIDTKTFENCFDQKIEKIPLINNGYYVDSFKFSENLFNHLGVIYSQEPSAMYPVELLDIKENDIVLDVCASPGGKSIQILEKLNGTGLLLSNEIVYKRAKILEENITRMGFDNYIISCNAPEDLQKANCLFDKILVDAPCGGEGMIRKNNFDINCYNPNAIDSNAKRQLDILESVKDLLKVGGNLVYSTCTYDIRENEQVVYNFLKNNSEFELVYNDKFKSICESGIKIADSNTDYTWRRYPHIHRGEGQFMALFIKKGEDKRVSTPKEYSIRGFEKVNNKELALIDRTLKGILDCNQIDFSYLKKCDEIFVLPKEKLDVKNLNILSLGCSLGTIQKDNLKISHEFYHTYGNLFKQKIELNEEEARKYIRGEELDTSLTNGIYAVTHLSIPLGGGKISNNRLKNYYKKNYRIQ